MKPRALRALAVAAALAAGSVVAGAVAMEDDDEAQAKAALDAARTLGEKVWNDKALGMNDKTCSGCHVNPKRPDLSLKGVHDRFPRWDRSAGRVLTLQEKFAQMHERNLKAKKPLPLGDERWTALEVYLRSLK